MLSELLVDMLLQMPASTQPWKLLDAWFLDREAAKLHPNVSQVQHARRKVKTCC